MRLTSRASRAALATERAEEPATEEIPTVEAGAGSSSTDLPVADPGETPTQQDPAPPIGELDLDGVLPEEDRDNATYWAVWGEPIGRTVKPALLVLESNVSRLTSAVVFSASGQALSWVGVDEPAARRISALAGHFTLLGGAALSRATQGQEDPSHLDEMHLVFGTSSCVVITMKDLMVGPLLLWAAVDDANLGFLTFQAKACAEAIGQFLSREDSQGL